MLFFFYSRASKARGQARTTLTAGGRRPLSPQPDLPQVSASRLQTSSFTCEGEECLIWDRLHVLIFEKFPVALTCGIVTLTHPPPPFSTWPTVLFLRNDQDTLPSNLNMTMTRLRHDMTHDGRELRRGAGKRKSAKDTVVMLFS